MKSRQYTILLGTEANFWLDFIVGVRCLDCKAEITSFSPMHCINPYPYAGTPKYEILEIDQLENKTDPSEKQSKSNFPEWRAWDY